MPPVVFTPPLVAYVTACAVVAATLLALTVRPPFLDGTLDVGAGMVFLLSCSQVRLHAQGRISTSAIVAIGLAVVTGPRGALFGAMASTAAIWLVTRGGWFRAMFNLSHQTAALLVAWKAYTEIFHAIGGSTAGYALASAGAALAPAILANGGVFAGLLTVLGAGPYLRNVRSQFFTIALEALMGFSAAGFVVLTAQFGAVGFAYMLAPLVGVQIVLVLQQRSARDLRDAVEHLTAGRAERQRLLKTLVAAQETERRRIANDLHDDAIQTLAAATIRAEQQRSATTEPTQRELAEKVLALLHDTDEHLRRVLANLRPVGLEGDSPMGQILQDVATGMFRDRERVMIEITDAITEGPEIHRKAVIFRVAQEALANVRKHTDATRVSILIENVGREVHIAITDNGGGFDVHARSASPVPGHLGLLSMRECAENAGGRVRIASRLGSGSTVDAWLPVSDAAWLERDAKRR